MGEGDLVTRYEDVAQDGRIAVRPLSNALGEAVWRGILERHPVVPALRKDGIVPILSRIVLVGGGGPISVEGACRARGTFAFTTARDRESERACLDMWAEVTGQAGRTHGPAPADAGATVALGAVYAEHVLTRPFAPPERRKVTEAPVADAKGRPWHAPEALALLPEGARWIDDEAVDSAECAFGLGHTDSNQHVNSLVYPLLAEEAALRWLWRHARPTAQYVDFCELRFRKPFFAGDVGRIIVRGYETSDATGVVARFVPHDGDPPGRAHAYARLELVD